MERTVYVGNITASITEDTLSALFGHCGVVTNVRISGDPTFNARFGFVEFEQQSMAHTACMLNGLMLAERSLKVSMAKTGISKPDGGGGGSGAGGGISIKPNNDPERVARTIHIAGIDTQVTEEHLAQYFGVCGEVSAVRISGDGANQQRFAWVEFSMLESAQGAAALDGQSLGTQQLKINPSKSAIQSNGLASRQPVPNVPVATTPPYPYAPPPATPQVGMPPLGQHPMGMPPVGMPSMGMPPPNSVPPMGMPPPNNMPPMGMPPPNNVPLMGMPPPTNVPPMGMPPPNSMPPVGMPPAVGMGIGMRGGAVPGVARGPPPGPPPPISSATVGIEPPGPPLADTHHRTVYVTCIDRSLSDMDLHQFFQSQCGTVIKVRMMANISQPMGSASVEFDTPAAASSALRLSGKQLGRCNIQVNVHSAATGPHANNIHEASANISQRPMSHPYQAKAASMTPPSAGRKRETPEGGYGAAEKRTRMDLPSVV